MDDDTITPNLFFTHLRKENNKKTTLIKASDRLILRRHYFELISR